MAVCDLDVPAQLADLVLGQPPAVEPPRPHAGSTDLGRRPLGLGPDNENHRGSFTILQHYLVEECAGDWWWEGEGVAVDWSLWLGDCEGCMLATSSRSSSLGTGNWTPFFFSSM